MTDERRSRISAAMPFRVTAMDGDIVASALRTGKAAVLFLLPPGILAFHLPFVAALTTSGWSGGKPEMSAMYPKGQAADQRLRHFVSG